MEIPLKYISLLLLLSLCSLSQEQSANHNDYLSTNGIILLISSGLISQDFEKIINGRDKKLNGILVPVKKTDNYPKNVLLKGSVFYKNNYSEFGLSYSYYSTGSRAIYTDYSGEYKYDEVIVNQEIGLIYRRNLLNYSSNINFQFLSALGISEFSYSSLEVFRFNKDLKENKYSSKNDDVFFELSINSSYYLKSFLIELNTSYMLYATNSSSANFKGFRGVLGIGYIF